MPLLSVRTSAAGPASETVEALLLQLSGTVAQHLGKPESYVMTSFEADVPMTFAGSCAEPVAYLELKSVGSLSPDATRRMSAELCRLIEEGLGVPAARTYIEFSPCEGHLWGWNGRTFG
jgi:phenylpyruvate tautomerase PptA (4-oxalocrotonate tautomerase family)